jgi:hypothetical protein
VPLRDEGQHSYKVHDAEDVQKAPPPPVDEYISDSTEGNDSEAPTTSRRSPSRVAAARRTRQTAGKIHASQAATQLTELKKRRGSRLGPRCHWTPPRKVPTSKPSTLKKTRLTCSREGNNVYVAGKAGDGDAPPSAWGAGVVHVKHWPSE